MNNFEDIMNEIKKDLENLELYEEPSFAGIGTPPNGHVYFFIKNIDTLTVRFALTKEEKAINDLIVKYRKSYKGNFEPYVNVIGTLNDVTFKFLK